MLRLKELGSAVSIIMLSATLLTCGGRSKDTGSESGIFGTGGLLTTTTPNDYGGSPSTGLVYSFVGWDSLSATGIYPDKMSFRCTATLDPGLGAVVAGTYSGDTNASELGFGVRGEALGGISVLNTSTASSSCSTDGGTTPGYISAIDIGPFDTTGKTGLRIFFEAAQLSDQAREFGLRLQYSIDNGANFTDYPGPVEFRSDTVGSSTAYTLYGPSAITQIENQSQVVLRLRYYNVSGASGSRTRIALRNLRISQDTAAPTFAGAVSASSPNMNTINLSWAAATDDVTTAGYMRYDIYQALTSGGQVYTTPSFTVRGTTTAQITSLISSTQYFYVIRARDEQGNRDTNVVQVNATTVADPNPPVISSFNPASGALWPVATNAVSVTFDKSMSVASLTTTTMKVVSGTDCSVAGLTVAGNPVASNANRTFTLTMTTARVNAQQYTTCITTGVQSVGLVALASAGSATWTATTATLYSDLIISEYMEGNSNNKFIEIYNGTGASVNLDNYRLGQYNNGSSTLFGTTLPFTAGTTLTHGSTWVVCNSGMDSLISSNCNQTSTDVVNFNGDDAVVLQKNTGAFVDLDIIGNNTGDPGASWNIPAGTNNAACTAGSTTCDTILKRMASVTGPTTSAAISFGQWNAYNASSIQNIEIFHGMGTYDATPATKAFNVVSAVGNAGATVTVTFNFEPTTASGQTIGNYDIRQGSTCGSGTVLAVSAAVRTAKTVALTTATQTNGQAYIVCATGILRFPDNAALSATNSATFTGTADTTAPTINSTTPADAATSIAFGSTVAVTFSEAMSTGTVTAQTVAGACSGSLQVSLDNFANCIAMNVAAPTFTAGNTVATSTPAAALTPGAIYKVRVTTTVQDVAGNALGTQYTSVTGFTVASLAEPTSVAFTPANTQITIGWTNSTNANAGVKIVRATGSAPADCTGAAICQGATCNATLTTGSAGRTYLDSGLTNGTQYFYRVCANHTSPATLSAGVTGSATPSNSDVTPPANPSSTTYVAGNGQVTLGWTNPSDGDFAGVKIVRADGTGTAPADCSGTAVCTGTGCNANVTAGATSLTYIDTGRTNGTQYAYRICAYDGVPNMSAGATGTATPSAGGVTHLVISQVYGAGGNSGATRNQDFVEIFNPTGNAVSLVGWSIQYTSATGTGTWTVGNITTGSVAPLSYFLVATGATGANGTALPAADATASGITMAAAAGKVALVNNQTALTGALPTGAQIIDFVGFGATANGYEGTGPTPAPSTTNSATRGNAGCTDTDQNASDFTAIAVSPRNSATAPKSSCP